MLKISEDLLEQAGKLLISGRGRSNQAAVRRAISNAYYSVFNTIIQEGVKLLIGNNIKDSDTILYMHRCFDHLGVKEACELMMKLSIPPKHSPMKAQKEDAAGLLVREFASLFIRLQKARHYADYDFSENCSKVTAAQGVEFAKDAIHAWNNLYLQHPHTLKQLVCLMLLNKNKRG